ncbi:hypothetical protein RRG08_046985 [Elysia crispata]|uniref:Guanylate cyclase n=1 Tax=Elysia crispata TaxID=231223 RepID=A0AAE1AAM8_9GAST|nr:hypothetical protein RRG08_046985 [Elysia crispata]
MSTLSMSMKFPVIQGPLASNTAASSVVCFLLFLLLSSASGSQQDGRPVVNLVTMESSGVQDGGMTYHVRFLKPLLDIALEDAHDRFGKYLDIQFKHIETLCGPSEIGALAAKEYYTEKVDVFFGPVCDDGVIPLGYMARAWNIPVISPRGNTRIVRNTTVFPNIISLHPYDKYELVRFTAFLLELYSWSHITIFVDKDNRQLETTGNSYYGYFQTSDLFWSYIPIYSKTFTRKDYDTKLKEASLTSRVFVLIMETNDVRELIVRANKLKMTTGEYVYIVPEFLGLARISSDVWRRRDGNDREARQGFRSVLYINIMSPPLSVYEPILERLSHRVFGNTSRKYLTAMINEDDTASAEEVQQTILTGYYNAIMMYLQVANETLAEGGHLRDGVGIVRAISNRTFQGIAGPFHINHDGHKDTDMALVDMTDPWNGTFERVGTYIAQEGKLNLNPGVAISWPGGYGPAPDIPQCGFKDTLCTEYDQDEDLDSTNLAIGLSTTMAFVIVGVILGVSILLRYKAAQRRRQLSWWKIDFDDLQPMKRNLTKSTFSSVLRQSNTNATETSLSACTVCMYKGNLVRQHSITGGQFQVTAKILREFEEIRDLNHPNLLRVVGAVLDGDKKVLVTEHCPKGSLQELISDNSFPLDTIFLISVLSDVVKALTYIHKRSIRYHGRLTSEVCLIDSRFSVKVGGYGLNSIFDRIQQQSKEDGRERDKLWMAPEHLRTDGKGSQEGDIYSLAIIMSEVISRDEPYSSDKEYLTTKEVLNKVRACEDPPFRPAVTAPPELVQLETVMKQSWDEDPDNRPTLYRVAGILHNIMSKYNKAGSLVDNLLQRLEKYSSNLEKIVDEKVDELRQEKHKSEELLRQMLPPTVADRLKAGMAVEPELYECVTIYFSDIIGFTEMCSELKPVQIVNLLNDLYSTFDSIIGNYDVYKVETIGDGYMVVSGLPTRNGNEHAVNIARMSLALLSVISNFTPIETNDERLMLRIGIHSGPVCAGVVGLKMPRYCLFGDTVNTASRMETNGMEWKIHMSGSTAEILKTFGTFVMKRRGEIEIKGKGSMETYWLLGEKEANPEIVVWTGSQPQPGLTPITTITTAPTKETSAPGP